MLSVSIDCQWYDVAIGDDQIRLPGLRTTYHSTYRVPLYSTYYQIHNASRLHSI